MILAGNSEGKSSLGRPTHCWVDNIKMDLRGVKWGGMDSIELVQEHGNEPLESIKCFENL
jgi:hypothetical protein